MVQGPMKRIELTMGNVVVLAIPVVLFAFFAVWILLTGYDDPALRIGLIASGAGFFAEVMVFKLWGGDKVDSRGDPVPRHDDWMREGGM